MISLFLSRFFSRILTVIKKYCWQREVHFGLWKKRGCKSIKTFLSGLFAFWSIALLCLLSVSVHADEYLSDNLQYCQEKVTEFGEHWPEDPKCRCDNMGTAYGTYISEISSSSPSDQDREIAVASAFSNMRECIQTAKDSSRSPAAGPEPTGPNICNTPIRQSGSCCLEKQREFGRYWPTDDKCNCSRIRHLVMNNGPSSLESQGAVNIVSVCVEEAEEAEEARGAGIERAAADDEKAAEDKKKCITFCERYAAATSQGCPGHSESLVNKCDSICNEQDVFENFLVEGEPEYDGGVMDSGDELFIRIKIENKWSGIRTQCIAEAKEAFVDAYAEKCEEKIEEVAEEHEKTILCAEDATKQNTECKEYCKSEAEELYNNEDITSESIAKVHMGVPPDANDENKRRVYQSLIGADMGSVVQREIAQLEIIGNENKLVDPLHWWPSCVKGKGQACESNLYRALEEAQDICSDLQNEARECCHEPEQCVGGGLAQTLDSLGKLNVAIAGMKGQKAQCEAVQQTFGMYGGMQGAMAARCMNKASACSRGCNAEVEKVAEAFGKACNHDPRTKANWEEDMHSCDKKLFDHYIKNYKGLTNTERISIGEVSDECKTTGKEANRRIQDMSTHLGTSLLAGMKECGMEPEEWKPTPPPEGCPPNCPPPPPTCPPVCPMPPPPPPPIETTGGGGGGGPSADPFADDPLPQAANPFDEDPDLGDGGPDVGKGVQKGMSGLLGGGGGTGGGGLGGLGGGGSSGGGRNRGGGAPAKKKKVLLGFKGGKFTGYGGGSSDRKERSRRASKRGKTKRKMSSLDLKKLLPKGKQLNHKVGKFGSPHDDIFQRLSDRIQWMCRTDQISCR